MPLLSEAMEDFNVKKHEESKSAMTRRSFMGTTAAMAAAGIATGPAIAQSAESANETLGIGVIGCGGRGGGHLATWKNVGREKNAEIVAVCDVYKGRLQGAMDKYKVKGYEDHRELLADPNVDVVSIATPDHWHGPQAIDAMKAGKDVYCEKPLTHWSQFEVAKEIAKVAKATGRVFLLGTQGMSDGAWWQMKQLVDDGLIGQPLHAECGYFRVGDWGERKMWMDANAQEGKDVNWELFLGDRPKKDYSPSRFFRWRMYEDYAGGPSTDLFPHSFTPVTTMFDLKAPAYAVATGGIYRYPLAETQKEDPNETMEREVPDTFNMLVDYPGGITCAILGTQGNATQNLAPGRGAGGTPPGAARLGRNADDSRQRDRVRPGGHV